MIEWKIYYDDGSTFSDLDGAPADAPWHGVVCIASKTAELTLHKWDAYYWWEPRLDDPFERDLKPQWWGSEHIWGVHEQFGKYPRHRSCLKMGAMVSTPFYKHCLKIAGLPPVPDDMLQKCVWDAFEARTE